MNVDGVAHRTIRRSDDGAAVEAIDQTRLPRELAFVRLETLGDAARAIRTMVVRGAPLIGATAAYGLWLAMADDPSDEALDRAARALVATRPTAVNLRAAVEDVRARLAPLPPAARADAALSRAEAIADEDVAINRAIGQNGLWLIHGLHDAADRARPVEVVTHCNAGWLATVDGGTALAPVYAAHDAGLPVHVWVTETRPRNQGSALTAWELGKHGVPHTVIVDGAAGHLMQRGKVDLAIVGTDRTTAEGDVANKIGTYMLAVAARDCRVPFYVALPSPTIDWTLGDGLAEIPIEERDAAEVTGVPPGSPASNPAFDVTPARLVTALVTERGICVASREGLLGLFPERRPGYGAPEGARAGADPTRKEPRPR
jgi:methylthioribose-1-phosphate isomerase